MNKSADLKAINIINLIKKNIIKPHGLFIMVIILVSIIRITVATNSIDVPLPSEVNMLRALKQVTSSKSLDTDFYNHPDNIYIFTFTGVSNIYMLLTEGKLVTANISNVINQMAQDGIFNNLYIHIGRVINVIFSCISIVIVYMIGNRFKDKFPKFGLICAILFSLFPSYSNWSGLMLSDTILTTCILLVMYLCILYIQKKEDKFLIMATIACAMSAVQKYVGVVSVIMIAISIIINNMPGIRNNKKNFLKKVFKLGIKMTLIFMIAMFILGSNLIVNYGEVIDILISEARDIHLGADGLGYFGNLTFYFKVFFNQTGIIISIFAILGIIAIYKKKIIKEGIILSFGILFILIISKLGLHWERWSLPMHVSLLIFCSLGFSYSWEKIKELNKYRVLMKIIVYISFLFPVIVMATDILVDNMQKTLADTRVVSRPELERLGITIENTRAEVYTPFIPSFYSEKYNVKEEDMEYYMVSSYRYNQYNKYPEKYPNQYNYYKRLQENYELVYQISPWMGYHLMMDDIPYGSFIAKTEMKRLENNISVIIDYYTTTQEKYYGPEIKVYKKQALEKQ